MIPKFNGVIVSGQFSPENPEKFFLWLKKLDNELVEAVIQKKRKQRSNPENKYYWGVIIKMISEEIGYSEDEAHEILKFLFLRKKLVIKRTSVHEVEKLQSTSNLSTIEFEDYLSKIRMWASTELNIYIPNPNEMHL